MLLISSRRFMAERWRPKVAQVSLSTVLSLLVQTGQVVPHAQSGTLLFVFSFLSSTANTNQNVRTLSNDGALFSLLFVFCVLGGFQTNGVTASPFLSLHVACSLMYYFVKKRAPNSFSLHTFFVTLLLARRSPNHLLISPIHVVYSTHKTKRKELGTKVKEKKTLRSFVPLPYSCLKYSHTVRVPTIQSSDHEIWIFLLLFPVAKKGEMQS